MKKLLCISIGIFFILIQTSSKGQNLKIEEIYNFYISYSQRADSTSFYNATDSLIKLRNDDSAQAIYNLALGDWNYYHGSYKEGLKISLNTFENKKSVIPADFQSDIYNKLQAFYYRLSKTDSALWATTEGLNNLEIIKPNISKEKYFNSKFKFLYALGLHYNKQKEGDKAKLFLKQALTFKDSIQLPVRFINSAQVELTNAFINQNNLDSAETIILNAYKLDSTNVFVLNTQAKLFKVAKNYPRAIRAYDKILIQLDTVKQVYLYSGAYINKALVVSLNKNYVEAEKLLLKGIKLAQKAESKSNELIALTELGEIYELNGNYKRLAEILKHKREIEIQIEDENIKTQIEQYEKTIELQVKEIELNKNKIELTQKTFDLENRNKLIIFLLIVLSILIMASIMLYYLSKKLQKSNAEKDKLFTIVAHDLRNISTSFQGLGDIIKSTYRKNEIEKAENILTKLDQQSNNLSHILDNLLHWSFQQLKRKSAEKQKSVLKDSLLSVISLFNHEIEKKNLSINHQIPEDILIASDPERLNIILRNLIGNAIKYSHKNAAINIVCQKKSSTVTLIIEDQGVGMSKDELKKTFEINKTSKKGTSGEKGSGLGLSITKNYIDSLKGKLHIDSQLNKGTTVYLELPLD